MKLFSSKKKLQDTFSFGVNVLADNVASTLGPKGRTVLLHAARDEYPLITKDGVTVAKFATHDDPFANAAMMILKQASIKTNLEAGDGTTTACVLARSIYEEALKYIEKGHSPVQIKREMEAHLELVLEEIKHRSKKIEDIKELEQVATISANNDAVIGQIIA